MGAPEHAWGAETTEILGGFSVFAGVFGAHASLEALRPLRLRSQERQRPRSRSLFEDPPPPQRHPNMTKCECIVCSGDKAAPGRAVLAF